MTIKPSSSPATNPTTTLIDSAGQSIVLAKMIGKGGEGSVYDVAGSAALVAKVYHKRPLDAQHVEKLEAMVAYWSEGLEAIAAWPRSLLYEPQRRQPCGLLMTKMQGARPLHELYGTTNRRLHFPEAGWHHLILAARNVAAAFHTLHDAGIVLGDVNQGNMLVDSKMCARLIDCDSFQIVKGGKVYSCPVGTPHFTPPELQSLKLRDVVRTVSHDRFGLGVLIFHILFVGRHPFAGRFRGQGDLSIERAIAERRFAFSKNRAATLVDPPPASLQMDDLPPELAALFERAFRSLDGEGQQRPDPLEWVAQLESLLKLRKACSFDDMHVFYGQLAECPWCRIEDAGGPTFFVPSGGTTVISQDRLTACDKKIKRLRPVEFPDLPAAELALPALPTLKAPKKSLPWTAVDSAVMLLVVSWLACLGGLWTPYALIAGAIGSLAAATWLVKHKPALALRLTAADYQARLAKGYDRLAKFARSVQLQHRKREAEFNDAQQQLHSDVEWYRAEGDQLREIITTHSHADRDRYLRGFQIRDYATRLSQLSDNNITMLESFGIETANDVDRLKLAGVPGVDGEITMALLDWREQMEKNFKFEPDHGITLKTLNAAGEMATKRFKLSQSRKVLMGAKQLDLLAGTGKSELSRSLAELHSHAGQWKDLAKRYREWQSQRRRLERRLNGSVGVIVGAAIGVPVLCWLVSWVVR